MIIEKASKISAGYFGKLPNHSDFIKHNAGGPEILMLDNWIQVGIRSARSKMKESWKNLYKNAPVYNFLYPFTNTSSLIGGIIRPEFDRSEREYPFITFLTIPDSSFLNKGFNLLPLMLSKHLMAINNLSDRYLPELNDEITGIELEPEMAADKFASYLNTTQNLFWQSTISGNVLDFKSNLLNLSKGSPAVKLIINCSDNLGEYKLSMIILLIMSVVKSKHAPAVFWSSKDITQTVFIFFEPYAIQYADLLNPHTAPVFDLNSLENEPDLNSIYKVFSDQSTLVQLVEAIKKL